MNKQNLNHFKTVLLEELNFHLGRPVSNIAVVQEELSSVDNHPADAATDLEMLATEMALSELSQVEVKRIRMALEAMQAGTYGYCKVCNEEIPYERLEVLPTAVTCVEHVSEIELN